MTEEIKKTYDKMTKVPGMFWFNGQYNQQWQILFDFYNEHHEVKLRTGCRPCYMKVMGFVKSKINLKHAGNPD